MTVRVRIAPSPTGPLHIGTARTALFNYLFARHVGGTFVLRLEDTDAARSELGYERDILEGLHWLGMEWDEGPEVAGLPARGPYGPYRQMERLPLYKEAADRLLAEDKAYYCYCTPEELAADRAAQEANHEPPHYVGRCAHLTPEERGEREAEGRKPVIRFRVGEGVVEFDDLVRGNVAIDTKALGGDLVIVRSDGTPLYHFSVVVDDAAMAITHVIRGEDHLSNTPKHILLFRALGAQEPKFAHLPLILNADRTKMSKRKSQTALDAYKEEGFVKEAIVNYLALLGWSSGTEEDIFPLDELVTRFELARVQSAGAVFDRERLEWLNGQWIRRLADDDLIERLMPFLMDDLAERARQGEQVRFPGQDEVAALLPLVRERLPVLSAIGPLVDFLFIEEIAVDPAQLVPKRWDPETTLEALTEARRVAADTGSVSFEADELEASLRALAESRGWKAGDLFMAIRVAVTGRTATPPLFDTLVALGYERTIERLDAARDLLAPATSRPA
ncbi:MAG: nondiscriminating glutamyl-tRNA synthetase [Chloroflexota bacterium]|jgi:glutamyl-tRNA synthetase|nr:nondiscriminating glutamyl-tRNA synthetase [Chloroflexota bacterium]